MGFHPTQRQMMNPLHKTLQIDPKAPFPGPKINETTTAIPEMKTALQEAVDPEDAMVMAVKTTEMKAVTGHQVKTFNAVVPDCFPP